MTAICPKCGSHDVRCCFYGMPGEFWMFHRRNIEIMGCIIGEDTKSACCNVCNFSFDHEWTTEEFDKIKKMEDYFDNDE